MHDTSKTYQEQAEEITLLKQRIQELQESESIYKMLFSNAAEGLLVAELQTKQFIHANPALCRMFGFSEEEILHLRVEDIHPKDSLADVLSEFETLTRGEKTCAIEIPCKRKDGSVFYADIRTSASMVLDGVMCNVGYFLDITERKQAEETLRESHAMLRVALDATGEAVLVIDRQGTIILANRVTAQRLQKSVAEIIGMSIYQLLPPEVANERREHVERVFQSGRPVDFADQRNGRFIDHYLYPIFEEKGQVAQIVIYSMELTERRQAEEAQRSLERKYRLLYNGMRDGFAYLNMDGTFRESNPAFEEMIGYSLEELSNLTFYDITPEKWRSTDERALKTMSTLGFSNIEEKEYRRKDGAIIPAEVRGTLLLDDQGKPSGIGVIVRDITERKQAEEALRKSEEKFRTIVNNMQDVVVRADLNGNITFASPSAAYTLGCSSTEEIIGLRIGSDFYFDPNEAQHHMEMLQRYGKLTRQEITLKRRDNGQPVIVSASIQFFHDNAGNRLGMEGVYRDITDRIQAEKEHEKLIRELQQALKEVKTLSSLLPICASCKKIRSDEGYWTQIEVYIKDHLDVEFSHGICDDCLKKLYPDIYKKKKQDGKP